MTTMNTPVLLLLLLLASPSSASDFDCIGAICEEFSCKPLEAEECEGKVVPHGGPCGCCDACLAVIGEGSDCDPAPSMGEIKYVICADTLRCNPVTSMCQRPIDI